MSADICANKHGGNEHSTAAFERITQWLKGDRLDAYDACFRPGGVTTREFAEERGVGMNAVSGRFSELKKAKFITQKGTRNGCGVWVPVQ